MIRRALFLSTFHETSAFARLAAPALVLVLHGCSAQSSDIDPHPDAGAVRPVTTMPDPSSGGSGGGGGSGETSGSSGSGGDGGSGGGASGMGGDLGTGGTVGTGGTGGSAAVPDAAVPSDAASGGSAGSGAMGTIHNPILPGAHADPQIAEFNGKFYIYPTTDGYADWKSPKFNAFSSTDLVTWHDEGTILNLGPDVSWADDRAWAPGIAFRSGTYYLYFCAAQQIGVATSSSPTGPFKDALGHALVKTSQYGVQSIDPYVFVDDDNRAYLYFGSGGARVVELNSDMVSFKGSPETLTANGFREGSVVFKRNGTYYFMWSENDTRSEDYHVSYATGKSPMGPFTKAAKNPVLSKDAAQGILGTGHNSVLKMASSDDYYIAYHRFIIPGGDGTHREVCLDRLTFNADGTIIPIKLTR